MDKRIDFKGVSLSPSDYECADDELAYAFNVDSSNGSLKVLKKYGELFSVGNDYTLQTVHHTATQVNYVFSKNTDGVTTLYYGTLGDSGFSFAKNTYPLEGDLRQVVPVGNTLVVNTSEGIYYMLWEEGDYTWLGGELPEVKVKPYLVTEQLSSDEMSLLYDVDNNILHDIKLPADIINDIADATSAAASSASSTIRTIELSEDVQTEMYNYVFGAINQYRAKLRDNGRFDAPFFIRFAWRLYDGSYIHHTSPMLMINSTKAKPYLYFWKYLHTNTTTNIQTVAARLSIYMLAADLYYSLIERPDNKWDDIIKGLDVFVSEPFITFTDSPKAIKSVKSLSGDTFALFGEDYAYQQYIASCNWARRANFDIFQIYNKHTDAKGQSYTFIQYAMNIAKGHTNALTFSTLRPQVDDNYFIFYVVYKKTSKVVDLGVIDENKHPLSRIRITGYDDDQSQDLYGTTVTKDFPYKLDFYEVYKVLIQYPTSKSNYTISIANGKSEDDTCNFVVLWKDEPRLTGEIELIREDGKTYSELAEETATFYRIKQLDLSELPKDDTPIKIDLSDGILNSLTVQPTLEDTGQCRTKITSNYIYQYNNRINTVIETQTTPYIDCPQYLQLCGLANEIKIGQTDTSAVYIGVVSVKNNQKILSYIKPNRDVPNQRFRFENEKYFYYPDSDAKELLLVRHDSGKYYIDTIKLKKHEHLSGAYALNMGGNGLRDIASTEYIGTITQEQAFEILKSRYTESYERGNIIYTSDVNNPFRFDEENANAIQNSKILALATNTQALSEGQFGAHPLYAFTEDGVWALSVAADGAYSSVQPVSRDVLINKDSVCSSDNSIFFGTQRGIIQLSGSQSVCITDILDGNFFNLGNSATIVNGAATTLIEALKAYIGDDTLINTPDELKDFLKNCRMAYDYVGQRIVFYLPYSEQQGADNPCMLVFNMRSKLWSMEENGKWLSAVNDYPDFYLNTSDGNGHNVILSTSQERIPHDTMFVMTRPMKLDAPDTMKTIRQIMTRGIFNRTDVQTMLYGSRDLLNWHIVGTSTTFALEHYSGTPYKFFSVGCYVPKGIVSDIEKVSLSGLTIRFITRDENKLR